MKKRSIIFIKTLCLAVLAATFISCQKNYEKIDYLETEAGDTKAFVHWNYTEGDSSLVKLNISPLPNGSNAHNFPKVFRNSRKSVNYYFFSDLENEKTYTVTVENFDNDDKLISSKTATVTPSEQTENYTYSREVPYIKLSKGRNFITLKGIKNKSINFANLNIGTDTIDGNRERIVFQNIEARSLDAKTPLSELYKKQFDTPYTFHDYTASVGTDSSRSAQPRDAKNGKEKPDTFDINNPKVGTDTRTLFLENCYDFFANSIPEYVEERAVTLRGIGQKDGKTICLVWVADDCYDEEKCEGAKVNSELAQNLADIFVDYYLHERDIAGEESNDLNVLDDSFDNGIFTQGKLTEWSKTGEAVNLVLYDLAKDFGKNSPTTYMGYFIGKDYYCTDPETGRYFTDIGKYSNCGKYIYIDTPICNLSYDEQGNESFNGNMKNGKYVPSGTIISTIMHEFQHLIFYGKKLYGQPWYNEMLSMLIEDIFFDDMSEKYGLQAKDSSRSRLSDFNRQYYYDWTQSVFDGNCYAPTYAFGAWLVRNYGGVQLIMKMCSDTKNNGFEAIVNAVNELNGFTGDNLVTKTSLLEQFLIACAITTESSEGTDLPTFNRISGEEYTSYGHTSKLDPLDLYSEEYKWSDSYNEWVGPLFMREDLRMDIPPAVFFLRAGYLYKDCDEATFLFTNQVSDDEEFFIFVQDEIKNLVTK